MISDMYCCMRGCLFECFRTCLCGTTSISSMSLPQTTSLRGVAGHRSLTYPCVKRVKTINRRCCLRDESRRRDQMNHYMLISSNYLVLIIALIASSTTALLARSSPLGYSRRRAHLLCIHRAKLARTRLTGTLVLHHLYLSESSYDVVRPGPFFRSVF